MDNRDRTLWVGNLSDRTKEEILYELFLQVSKMKISNMKNHNIDKICNNIFIETVLFIQVYV